MESMNVDDFIIQFDYEKIKYSLDKDKKVVFCYYCLYGIGVLLGIYYVVNFKRFDICFIILPTLLMGISLLELYAGNVCERIENMRNGERLVKMIFAGAIILDIQRKDAQIFLIVEQKSYEEEKEIFSLLREEMIFNNCKKLYSTKNTSTIFNINNLVLTIPYSGDLNVAKL